MECESGLNIVIKGFCQTVLHVTHHLLIQLNLILLNGIRQQQVTSSNLVQKYFVIIIVYFSRLDLQMTTMWDKSLMDDEEVYRLSEDIAFNLHPAEHDPLTPRLLCVLQEGTFIAWNTFCLSDFIRCKCKSIELSVKLLYYLFIAPKRGLSSTNKIGIIFAAI